MFMSSKLSTISTQNQKNKGHQKWTHHQPERTECNGHDLTNNGMSRQTKPDSITGICMNKTSALFAQKKRLIAKSQAVSTKLFFPAHGLKIILLASGLSVLMIHTDTASARTYWLNIPGAYSKVDEQYLPPVSYPTPNHNACSDAVMQYAKDNLVHYIGCDVMPLPDAVNLPPGQFRPGRHLMQRP